MEKITVIGIGRLGICLALLLEKAGYQVLGVDVNQSYVDQINHKTLDSPEPSVSTLLKSSKNLTATTSLIEGLNFSSLIYILVPTPNSGGERFYDHSILSNLLSKINQLRVDNKISSEPKDVVVGCTVMPGYINEIGKFLLADCPNYTVNYNPEFIAQGDIINGFLKSDIILIGCENAKSGDRLRQIYQRVNNNEPDYCLMSPLEAEITKISINGFVTTKISFANMLSDLCDRMGADKKTVLNAIGGDSRIGRRYFNPGHSYGGPCFPRDTLALRMLLDQQQVNSDLLTATHQYNQIHIGHHVDLLLQQIDSDGKPLQHFVIQDVCYKENSQIPIIEESAKLKIAKELVNRGKQVTIKDIKSLVEEVKKDYGNIFNYKVVSE